MLLCKHFNGFHLHNHRIRNDQVSKIFADNLSCITNFNLKLSPGLKSKFFKFDFQAFTYTFSRKPYPSMEYTA